MKSLVATTVYDSSNSNFLKSLDVFDDINIIPLTPRPGISRNLLSSLSELGNNSTHMGNEVPCTPIPNSSAGVSGDMSLENSKCERIK